MSIINLFSFVVPSLTRHSYREKLSVQRTTGKLSIPNCRQIRAKVVENEIAASAPVTIEYSSEARTARVTRLHFVELYLIILLFQVKESS